MRTSQIATALVLVPLTAACVDMEDDIDTERLELSSSSYRSFSGVDDESGTVRVDYGGKVPLLSSFFFDFLGSDHHLWWMQVRPNMRFSDGSRRLAYAYQDAGDDDSFGYDISVALVEPGAIIDSGSVNGTCDLPYNIYTKKGQCHVNLPPAPADSVFVLTGFWLRFEDNDHHIDQIAVIEDGGKLWFGLNDKNDDDPFTYSATYAYLPRWMFLDVDEVSDSYGMGIETVSTTRGIGVIRGFELDFSGDHHIDEVGVELPAGTTSATISFNDKNDDDRFRYRVKYGILPTYPLVPPPIGVFR